MKANQKQSGILRNTSNPGVAAGIIMNQQGNNPGIGRGRAVSGRFVLAGSGPGTTTVIRPAPGATTDVLVNNPGQMGTTTLNVSGRVVQNPQGTGISPAMLQQQPTVGYTGTQQRMVGFTGTQQPMVGYTGAQQPQVGYTGTNYPDLQPGQRNSFTRFNYQPNLPRTSIALQQPQFTQFQDTPQQQQQLRYMTPSQTYLNSGTSGPGTFQQPGQPNYGQRQGGDIYGGVIVQRGSSTGSISSRRRLSDDEYMRQIMLGLKAATGMPFGGFGGMGLARSPFGFDIMYNTQNVFVQPSQSDFADLFSTPNVIGKYDILDSNGDRLFYAADILGRTGSGCCSVNPDFAVSIMSCDGTEVLSVTGDSTDVVMRSMMASPSLDTKSILGYVAEDTNCCSMVTSYGIKDRTGNLCFRLLREPSNPNPTEYEVFGNDMVKIGRMSKIWAGLPRRSQQLAHTYGISFPLDMEVREKAMMMGTCIAVYMKYYGDRKRDRRLARHAWYCAIFMVLLFALIIVGIIFVIIHITL